MKLSVKVTQHSYVTKSLSQGKGNLYLHTEISLTIWIENFHVKNLLQSDVWKVWFKTSESFLRIQKKCCFDYNSNKWYVPLSKAG